MSARGVRGRERSSNLNNSNEQFKDQWFLRLDTDIMPVQHASRFRMRSILHLDVAERHMASVEKACLQASLRRTFSRICRMAEQESILFESLILAQDERWRRA